MKNCQIKISINRFLNNITEFWKVVYGCRQYYLYYYHLHKPKSQFEHEYLMNSRFFKITKHIFWSYHSAGVANLPLGKVLFAEWLHSPFAKGGWRSSRKSESLSLNLSPVLLLLVIIIIIASIPGV